MTFKQKYISLFYL